MSEAHPLQHGCFAYWHDYLEALARHALVEA